MNTNAPILFQFLRMIKFYATLMSLIIIHLYHETSISKIDNIIRKFIEETDT